MAEIRKSISTSESEAPRSPRVSDRYLRTLSDFSVFEQKLGTAEAVIALDNPPKPRSGAGTPTESPRKTALDAEKVVEELSKVLEEQESEKPRKPTFEESEETEERLVPEIETESEETDPLSPRKPAVSTSRSRSTSQERPPEPQKRDIFAPGKGSLLKKVAKPEPSPAVKEAQKRLEAARKLKEEKMIVESSSEEEKPTIKSK